MLCKNCNYILSGKENFCPNCASPVKAVKIPDPEEVKEETVPVHDEKIISKEYIFPKVKEDMPEKQPHMQIFSDALEKEETESKHKKSYGGKIMLLLFLICLLTAASFAVIDYFDLTSSVFSFAGSEIKQEEKETSESLFNHNSSIVKPDISYTPSAAYVMSGKGLTLRKGPDNAYAPIANLSDLTEVQVYGASALQGSWVYVYCSQTECYGWLDSSFLTSGVSVKETTLFAENE